jgi:molybdenum cofactor guanylyltransferase
MSAISLLRQAFSCGTKGRSVGELYEIREILRVDVPSIRPAAIILCGGESKRMGRPKAWLPFGQETLLQRVVRLAATVADPMVVVAAPEQPLPDLSPDVIIVRDSVSGRGPLQGLATGFAALPTSVTLAYATATDVPFLEPGWITRLVGLIGDADLAIPEIGGYFHPLAALYRPANALPAIVDLLAQDRLRPVFLVESIKTRVVTEEEMRAIDDGLGTLKNLNHSEDYEHALAAAGFG